MSGQKLGWKDFRNRMKKKRSGEKRNLINVSLIKDLKSCLKSLARKRFQERWENTNKSSHTEICICNLSSNTNLASVLSITYLHLFLQSRQKKKPWKENILSKLENCRSKTKPWTKTNYNEIVTRRPQRICRV